MDPCFRQGYYISEFEERLLRELDEYRLGGAYSRIHGILGRQIWLISKEKRATRLCILASVFAIQS